jgi:hypothetical protein
MRRTIYLVLFLLLATLAGLLTLRAQRTVAVLVAAHDVQAGAQLAAQDVEMHRVHQDSIPSGALSSPDDAVGQYVAWPLTAGEPVLARAIRHQRSGIALVADVTVPDGYRAIAVPVQPAGAVGGMLSPGDRVDVYATPLPGHQPEATSSSSTSVVRRAGSVTGTINGATANNKSPLGTLPGTSGGTADAAGGSPGLVDPGTGADTPPGAEGTTMLGTDLLVLQLRSDQGQPLGEPTDRSVHGLDFGAGKLGSVVLAVPADQVPRFAAAAASDTVYLALSVG